MPKAKVKRNFMQMNVPDKIAFGTGRITDIPLCPAIASPTAGYSTIADATTANGDLTTAYTNFQNGGAGTEAALDTAETAWKTVFGSLADWTDFKAQGDETIITCGGWEATDVEPSPRPLPGDVDDLDVIQNKQPGVIDVTSKKPADSDFVVTIVSRSSNIASLITYADDQLVIPNLPEAVIFRITSKTNISIRNLDSGSRYYLFRFGINNKGKGPNSQTITIIAP